MIAVIPTIFSRYSRRDWVALTLLFIAYVAAAQIGRFLFTAPAVIQPAAGVALAGLVLGGLSLAPAVGVAALVNGMLGTAPFPIVLGGAVAHLTHALAGASLLRIFGFDATFSRVRDTLLFICIALTTSMLVPSIGMLSISLYNAFAVIDWPFRATWVSWWSGIMIGDLVLAAALIRSIAKPFATRTPSQIVEVVLAFATLFTLTYLVSWTNASEATNGILVIFWLLPFIWFSLRLGTQFTFIAFATSTAIVLTGVLYGDASSPQSISARIITSEIFMAVLALIFFLFTAVVEERRRATDALQAQLRRVGGLLEETRRQDRAKSDFIAVLAHELRNPLAPVVSAVEILKLQFGADARIASTIETLEERTRTVVRLLDDLLDVSRLTQQKFKLRRESMDLATHVTRTAESLRNLAERNAITLTIIVPSTRVSLDADPVRIEQIISNLLINAIKYTDRGGTVTVTLTTGSADAHIRIRDTGIGIAPHMLEKIFIPFAGLGIEHRQQTIKEGLGIGLWLTENLVKTHGGSIQARSEGNGKGSEFIVRLPLSTVSMDKPTPTSDALAHNGSLRILIVDDNEAAANGLGLLLQHVGNRVDFAYVGADVATRVQIFMPDVIVLDIGLPDMTGYEVAHNLRTNGFRGRIIALTGYGQDEDKKKAAAAGFDHHLTKPVGLADLQSVLMPLT